MAYKYNVRAAFVNLIAAELGIPLILRDEAFPKAELGGLIRNIGVDSVEGLPY